MAVHAGETPKASPVLSDEGRATYEKRVLPFLKKYCWKCHDEGSAEAGFRVDELGTDFLAGKTADHWREAIDQINLGKMPKTETKPDPRDAFAVVEWVNLELRNAEKRAQSTGGRVPMRRLNRTEYANTVRDLFHLDENFARKIEQELPADGKVDGFDRGGAALPPSRAHLRTRAGPGRGGPGVRSGGPTDGGAFRRAPVLTGEGGSWTMSLPVRRLRGRGGRHSRS